MSKYFWKKSKISYSLQVYIGKVLYLHIISCVFLWPKSLHETIARSRPASPRAPSATRTRGPCGGCAACGTACGSSSKWATAMDAATKKKSSFGREKNWCLYWCSFWEWSYYLYLLVWVVTQLWIMHANSPQYCCSDHLQWVGLDIMSFCSLAYQQNLWFECCGDTILDIYILPEMAGLTPIYGSDLFNIGVGDSFQNSWTMHRTGTTTRNLPYKCSPTIFLGPLYQKLLATLNIILQDEYTAILVLSLERC